jgi:hypothetical protein
MSKARELADVIGTQSTTENVLQGRRNLIINGAMQVAQRGTSVTTGPNGTGEGLRTVDRFGTTLNHGTAATTQTQSTDAPDGFSNSLMFTVSTAQSSLGTSDFWMIYHRIEGQNLQHLNFGKSTAKQVTVSFWVKATKTGINCLELNNYDGSNRMTTQQYTVNASNTWEYKTLTFDGDTVLGFDNDNNLSLGLNFWVSAGTQWSSGTTTGWAGEVVGNRAPSQVNNLDAVNNIFAITGVQLEVGSVATPFEHRSYGEELALCQRYFYKGSTTSRYAVPLVDSWTYKYVAYELPVEMRSPPTISYQYAGNDLVAASSVSADTMEVYFQYNSRPSNLFSGVRDLTADAEL